MSLILYVPAFVGIPLTSHVSESNVSPSGSPVAVTVMGAVPVIVTVREYSSLTMAFGRIDVVIVGLTGLALMLKFTVNSVTLVPAVAVTFTLKFPAVLGVPEISPALLSESPEGRDDNARHVTEPEADTESCCLTAYPTYPEMFTLSPSSVAIIFSVYDFEAVPYSFEAVTVKVKVPDSVGVPEITPVEALMLRPAGRVPEVTAHVIGAVPDAVRVCEYSASILPSGRLDVDIVGLTPAAAIVTVKVLEAVPYEFLAVIVIRYVPALDGVPDNVPADVFRLTPEGRPLAVHVIGAVPSAERVAL